MKAGYSDEFATLEIKKCVNGAEFSIAYNDEDGSIEDCYVYLDKTQLKELIHKLQDLEYELDGAEWDKSYGEKE